MYTVPFFPNFSYSFAFQEGYYSLINLQLVRSSVLLVRFRPTLALTAWDKLYSKQIHLRDLHGTFLSLTTLIPLQILLLSSPSTLSFLVLRVHIPIQVSFHSGCPFFALSSSSSAMFLLTSTLGREENKGPGYLSQVEIFIQNALRLFLILRSFIHSFIFILHYFFFFLLQISKNRQQKRRKIDTVVKYV